MTDYGMPEADTAALDRAWTEERFRRAAALAADLYEAALPGLAKDAGPDLNGSGATIRTPASRNAEAALHPGADPRPMAAKARELSGLLYELGIHLDETAGYNITGGDAP